MKKECVVFFILKLRHFREQQQYNINNDGMSTSCWPYLLRVNSISLCEKTSYIYIFGSHGKQKIWPKKCTVSFKIGIVETYGYVGPGYIIKCVKYMKKC